MAGSGSRKKRDVLKNKAMLVVRNETQQEVTNVIFPNGLTVGTIDFTNGAKVHGNVQVAGILNAQGVRVNGNEITGTAGPPGGPGGVGAGVVISPGSVSYPADFQGTIDSSHASLGNTSISMILGGEALTVDNTSPFDDNSFRVGTPTTTGISVGSTTQTDGSASVDFTIDQSTMTGDSASIVYPVTLNVSGSEVTFDAKQTFAKAKEAPPTPVGNLSNTTIDIPTDFLGRNPNDNAYFSLASDFPAAATTLLTVTAGSNTLTWNGDNSVGDDPPEGKFSVIHAGTTGSLFNTENASLGSAMILGGSGTGNTNYEVDLTSPASNNGLVSVISFTASGDGVLIKPVKLGEFDDHSPASPSFNNGTRRFDNLYLEIPVKATIGGVTTYFKKVFTISKSKEAVPTPEVSLSNETINIIADANGGNAGNAGSFWSTAQGLSSGDSTIMTVTAGTDTLTWNGDENSSSPSNPDEGTFKIDWQNTTGVTDTGKAVTFYQAQSWAASPTLDTSAELRYATTGRILDFTTSEESGKPKISMDFLSPFDNNPVGQSTGGSTTFDTINFTIPVLITLGGTTVTVNKGLTVQKIRQAQDGLNEIQVQVSPTFIGFVEDTSNVVTPTLNGSQARFTVTVKETDLSGNTTTLTNTSTSPPPSGEFRIGATSNGTFTDNTGNLGTSHIVTNNGGSGYLQVASLPTNFSAGALSSLPVVIRDSAGNNRDRDISVSLSKTSDGTVGTNGSTIVTNNLVFTFDYTGKSNSTNAPCIQFPHTGITSASEGYTRTGQTFVDNSGDIVVASQSQIKIEDNAMVALGFPDAAEAVLWIPLIIGSGGTLVTASGTLTIASINRPSEEISIGLYETNGEFSSSPSKLIYKEIILIDGNTKATLSSGIYSLSLNNGVSLQNLYGYAFGVHFRNSGTPTGGGSIEVDLTLAHEV